MKDLLLRASVVVRISDIKISRRRLTDYTSKHCTKKRAARAARLFFLIQPIKSMICGVVVEVAVVKSQTPLYIAWKRWDSETWKVGIKGIDKVIEPP